MSGLEFRLRSTAGVCLEMADLKRTMCLLLVERVLFVTHREDIGEEV